MPTLQNDFRSLFRTNNTETKCFRKALQLSPDDQKILLEAKKEIRKVIREGFETLKQSQKYQELKTVSTPKFAQQGSFVYGTINNPAYPPKQQLDLDYGIYLPFSDLEDGKFPKQTTDTFFSIVESLLINHIKNNKPQWELAQKTTCVRVILNEKMHIDLPLYGCPDAELSRVVEAAEVLMKSQNIRGFFDFNINEVKPIDSKFIHLAHRKKGWVNSDPLIIRDWVKTHSHSHGPNNFLKDICRYLKAWRDEVKDWRDGGGPSSILLLALTIELYSTEADGVHAQLEEIINGLDERLLHPVNIPAPGQPNDEEDLLQRLTLKELQDIKRKIYNLKEKYQKATTIETTTECNKLLQEIFGHRFPYRPEDIKQLVNAETIRKTPSVIKAALIPPSVTSG